MLVTFQGCVLGNVDEEVARENPCQREEPVARPLWRRDRRRRRVRRSRATVVRRAREIELSGGGGHVAGKRGIRIARREQARGMRADSGKLSPPKTFRSCALARTSPRPDGRRRGSAANKVASG